MPGDSGYLRGGLRGSLLRLPNVPAGDPQLPLLRTRSLLLPLAPLRLHHILHHQQPLPA